MEKASRFSERGLEMLVNEAQEENEIAARSAFLQGMRPIVEIKQIGNLIPIPHPSIPLWYLTDNSPVMILGGIPNRKVVLLSTNEFDSFSILELNIDSCWIGSLSCPQGLFSATVYDAIATESMLFIRQNQLMYYFKGNFTLLRNNDEGSETANFRIHYDLPLNIPKGMDFYNLGTTWLAIPGVPPHSLIQYFTHSWNGDFIFMTDIEELWYGRDGFSKLTRLSPSKGWTTFVEMQKIKGMKNYYKSETTLTVFFDRQKKLKEVVYAALENGTTTIFKRDIPVDEILSYEELFSLPSYTDINDTTSQLTFLDNCPFGVIYMQTAESNEFYSRIQNYVVKPPWIFSNTELVKSICSLVLRAQDICVDIKASIAICFQHYHFYLASNKLSKAGLYVETYDYRKKYDKLIFDKLSSVIYLDKGKGYEFRIYLTVNTGEESEEYEINQAWMSAQVSSPDYVLAELQREELLSRGNLIYKGSIQMKVYVGCPPGNRLAFDIAYTLNYSINKNNMYFDCLKPDEIPCFYYEHPFYPFFLIQDMVTGKSNQFMGRYTFKVIGGGPYKKSNIRNFSPREILLYNSVKYRHNYAAIWTTTASNPSIEQYTNDGFLIFRGDAFGIRWVCQKNSPCSDVPAEGLKGPEYFFVIEVSNRGIDASTYCDYRLKFIIHVHGLPLNPHRALFFMLITLAILWSVLFAFVIYRCCLSWFERKIKLLTSVDPMILPARSDMIF
ncbi:cation channel sperm-associated auxiliary subunit gamma-like [Pristis pectinata]|uniref:cation channel sperm-associated auxiliary subunit gamma-like n=1 Tax=Pristis pectinata TaxID=685728 RepID=UPI00223D3AD8|nr:cation channel sperm-associated auxiliary subunit gamma-like [Pristis pectinata]